MGSFDLSPKEKEHYRARIVKPEGILEEFVLPEASKVGYVLHVGEQSGKSLSLSVNSWRAEELSLIAQTRGKIYYAQGFSAAKGENTLTINTDKFPIGISQITLLDKEGIERCERLVFVNKDKQLNISVTTAKEQYKPREKVLMNIKVTDEKGLPVPGNFSLSVVDDNLLSFADDKQGTILSKILLEPDLKEKVEEPHFYFNSKEPKADRALDLLLMTSGWRRYTWKQIIRQEFPVIKFQGEKATLAGIVYDGNSGKPLSGVQLKFKESGRSTTTDKEGKFSFNKIDISTDKQLEISANEHPTQVQEILEYSTNLSYYLYDNHRVFKNRGFDVMPMAVGGAMEERMFAANEGQPAEAQMFKQPLGKDVAPDLGNEIPVNKNEDVLADEIHVAVDDVRLNDLKAFDKNAEKTQELFYRAKEFPKKKYSPQDTTRNDFATTVYWNGNVETDRNGRAQVEFITNDLISSFKTTIEGFGDDGSIGRTEFNFSTNLPFTMDVKIPVEVVSGDKMMIPVFLKNNTSSTINGRMIISAPKQLQVTSKQSEVILTSGQSKVIYLDGTATNEIGEGKLEIKFTTSSFNDAITRNIKVIAKGFPANISLSGQDLQKDFSIHPQNVVPGSLKATFTAYPNIMSELMDGVESILREPHGCFEQASSSTYPNIMVLNYLKAMEVNDPKLEAKANKWLDEGYKKLIAYETKENGYEWFGAAPAHEALTAYGLMEFTDMKKVYGGVDEKMLERTAKLLLDKRDGNGGFIKNPQALDSFGAADEDVTNAYIVYALSEAGYKNIEKELDAVVKSAKKTNDPYIIALCANALFNFGDKERGEEMLTRLIKTRSDAGFWTGAKHSITRSTGLSLHVETTSLSLLALMKSQNPNNAAITGGIKYLIGSRSGFGGFGSPQATILALKALTKYAEFSKRTDESGTVEIWVNGTSVASKGYAKGQKGNIEITGLEKFIQSGKQKVEVKFKDCKQALPYAVNITYSTTLPASSKECVVTLETQFAAKQVKVGETLRLSATLTNKTGTGQPMTMAMIGIPAGFSAQPWQLKELQEKGFIDFYEIIGNNIACYFRALAPNAKKQINLDLKAEIPGEYEAPASNAYLYYTAEHKNWVASERVFVNP
ncbi:MAG: hypothetical protein IPP77_15735 [Bacteroidetes bacterium]|nr:hypothetical protein [Bacteroidota bacterium]